MREIMNRAAIMTETIRMVGPYPAEATPFYLPVSVIHFYDDPYSGLGDEGYDVETLKDEISRTGQVTYCIQVGKRRGQDNPMVYSFNGNHRLAAAKELRLKEIICENSGADDAKPLTVAEILNFGGRFLEAVPPDYGLRNTSTR